MRMLRRATGWVSSAALVAIMLSTHGAQAAIQNIVGGELRGASGVNVDGALYDVEFVEGTCVDLYDGCDAATDFTFQSLDAATLAGDALLDQVFLNRGAGDFDTIPGLTFGCSGLDFCGTVTPFGLPDAVNVSIVSAINFVAEASDAAGNGPTNRTFDSGSSNLHELSVFAVWTPVSGAGPASEHPGAFGPNDVGHRVMSVFDAARANRELPLQIWYPADAAAWTAEPSFTFTPLVLNAGITSTVSKDDLPLAGGTYPLIVFSHGYGGFNIQSLALMEHLASHGFVVVAPNHTGNTQDDQSSPDPEADRYPDIAFVIDEMIAENADVASPYFGHVDGTNAGVAGHSYGGMTSQFMAAGHDGNPPDPRVNAIMPVAPSSASLTDSDLQGITIPTLLMVGTLDGLQAQTERSWQLISSAPDLFRVDVTGANHTHFANVCDIGNVLLDAGIAIEQWPVLGAGALIPIFQSTCIPPAFPIAEATRIQNLYAAAHFRRYLLGDTDYDAYLTQSYALATEPHVVFFGPLGEGPPVPVLGPLGHGALLLLLAGVATIERQRFRLGTQSTTRHPLE